MKDTSSCERYNFFFHFGQFCCRSKIIEKNYSEEISGYVF